MKEIWKPVVGYEGLYEVSNLGNIKSLGRYKVNKLGRHTNCKPKMIKKGINHKGYEVVSLTDINGIKKQFFVHRIVAFAFTHNDNLKEFNQVNHIDGNKLNNHFENLEWCNNSLNQIHAFKNGLNHTSVNAGRKNISINKRDLLTMEIIDSYTSISEAAKLNKCSETAIKKAIRGLNKNNPKHIYKLFYFEINGDDDYKTINPDEIKKYIDKYNICNGNIGVKNPIYKLDKNTEEIICVYESATEASKLTGINQSNIIEACLNHRYKTVGGYKWRKAYE